jgi:hypothetical protein
MKKIKITEHLLCVNLIVNDDDDDDDDDDGLLEYKYTKLYDYIQKVNELIFFNEICSVYIRIVEHLDAISYQISKVFV